MGRVSGRGYLTTEREKKMTEAEKEKELASLKELTERFLAELKAGDYFKARSTALTLHYGADILWANRKF